MREKVNIVIEGNERNKNEIIYNNVIDSMNKMNLSKEEQVEYLKQKVANLESDHKNKAMISILIICGFLLLLAGLYFMYVNLYVVGIVLVIGSFLVVVWDLYRLLEKIFNGRRDDKFDQVEQLRRILNMRLK